MIARIHKKIKKLLTFSNRRPESLTEEEKQFFRVMCLPPEPILHPKPGPSISKKTIESNRDNVSIKRTESDRKLFQSNPD